MKRLATMMVAALLVAAGAPAAHAALSDFAGLWTNTDAGTSGITRLNVRVAGAAVSVQAYGKAHPTDSDFGVAVGVAYGPAGSRDVAGAAEAVVAQWTPGFCQRLLVLHADGSGGLQGEELVRFTDNSGRAPYRSTYTFARQAALVPIRRVPPIRPVRPVRPLIPVLPGRFPRPVLTPPQPSGEQPPADQLPAEQPPADQVPTEQPPADQVPAEQPPAEQPPAEQPDLAEDLVGFNPNTTQTVMVGGSWKLVDGSHALLDFGPKVADARGAFKVIRHYGLNQHGFVGRPNPSFEYWLVDGRAPEGALPGEDAIAFDPAQLRVDFVGGEYKIVEGAAHWMFSFAANKENALKALAIIQKYGFTHSCFVGRPGPKFTYFRK